jgi:hypothetical protein
VLFVCLFFTFSVDKKRSYYPSVDDSGKSTKRSKPKKSGSDFIVKDGHEDSSGDESVVVLMKGSTRSESKNAETVEKKKKGNVVQKTAEEKLEEEEEAMLLEEEYSISDLKLPPKQIAPAKATKVSLLT